ncbi:hypothetical protein AW736_03000 [Termitidicoccus mucosus]|uniref:Uncharacterized protein n=1 Tax=Termitidicoccus mucosus TaxID=1184151 RepID=A0A178IP12_9BACT|nr:hypothetical protein AW736_03000 [Opitutaceae bacterium TSB47]
MHLGVDLLDVPLQQGAARGGQAFEQGQAGGVLGLVGLVLERLDQGLARLEQFAQHRLGLDGRAAGAQFFGFAREQAEQAGVDAVGLGQDALGPGELAHAPGVDHAHAHAGLMAGAREGSFVAAGGLADDPRAGGQLREETQQARRALREARHALGQVRDETGLGEINADVFILVWHGRTPSYRDALKGADNGSSCCQRCPPGLSLRCELKGSWHPIRLSADRGGASCRTPLPQPLAKTGFVIELRRSWPVSYKASLPAIETEGAKRR